MRVLKVTGGWDIRYQEALKNLGQKITESCAQGAPGPCPSILSTICEVSWTLPLWKLLQTKEFASAGFGKYIIRAEVAPFFSAWVHPLPSL